MAANYWVSSQRLQWQMTRERLQELRTTLEEQDIEKGLAQKYTLPDHRQLSVYFHCLIQKLGRRLTLRQQPLATAEIYFKRFYTKVSLRETNVYLMLSTCVYLACKMEECPQHIRSIVSEARVLFSEYVTSDTTKLAECEFYLISELNSYLIIHHPYRTLTELQTTLKLTAEDYSSSWSFINDTYATDLLLLYAPHVVAITAIFLSVLVKPTQSQANLQQAAASAISAAASSASLNSSPTTGTNTGTSLSRSSTTSGTTIQPTATTASLLSGVNGNRTVALIDWLAESGVDIEAVIECTQEMISLYDVWENHSEKTCKEQLNRMIKGRQFA